MSGLFDDEGKTPARGRKHKASEASVAELAESPPVPTDLGAKIVEDAREAFENFKAEEPELVAKISEILAPVTSDEMAKAAQEFDAGHPFEDSVRAAKAIAADEMYVPGWPGFKKIGSINLDIPRTAAERIAAREQEMVNRFPISQERRQRMLDLVWERTKYKTGRVEWRDVRDLLKDVIELL